MGGYERPVISNTRPVISNTRAEVTSKMASYGGGAEPCGGGWGCGAGGGGQGAWRQRVPISNRPFQKFRRCRGFRQRGFWRGCAPPRQLWAGSWCLPPRCSPPSLVRGAPPVLPPSAMVLPYLGSCASPGICASPLGRPPPTVGHGAPPLGHGASFLWPWCSLGASPLSFWKLGRVWW